LNTYKNEINKEKFIKEYNTSVEDELGVGKRAVVFENC